MDLHMAYSASVCVCCVQFPICGMRGFKSVVPCGCARATCFWKRVVNKKRKTVLWAKVAARVAYEYTEHDSNM